MCIDESISLGIDAPSSQGVIDQQVTSGQLRNMIGQLLLFCYDQPNDSGSIVVGWPNDDAPSQRAYPNFYTCHFHHNNSSILIILLISLSAFSLFSSFASFHRLHHVLHFQHSHHVFSCSCLLHVHHHHHLHLHHDIDHLIMYIIYISFIFS